MKDQGILFIFPLDAFILKLFTILGIYIERTRERDMKKRI